MTTFEAMATEDVHHARAKICSVFFRYLEVLVYLLVVYKYRYIFIFALCVVPVRELILKIPPFSSSSER